VLTSNITGGDSRKEGGTEDGFGQRKEESVVERGRKTSQEMGRGLRERNKGRPPLMILVAINLQTRGGEEKQGRSKVFFVFEGQGDGLGSAIRTADIEGDLVAKEGEVSPGIRFYPDFDEANLVKGGEPQSGDHKEGVFVDIAFAFKVRRGKNRQEEKDKPSSSFHEGGL